MKTKLYHFIADISIKNKLFLVFLLLIPLPFLVYMLINNYAASRNAESQAIYSASQMMSQSSSYLESKIDLVNNTMNMVSNTDTVQTLLKQTPEIYEDNLGLWYFNTQQVEKQFYYMQPAEDIVRIRLYTNGGITDIDETATFKNLNKIRDAKWHKKLASGIQPMQWFTMNNFEEVEKENYISAVRRINDSQNLRQWVGVIRVDLKESMFKTMLFQTKYTETSTIFLLNSSNDIICSTESSFSSSDLTTVIGNTILTDQSGKVSWGYTDASKSRYLILVQDIEGTDWRFIQAIPYPDIYKVIRQANKQLLIIILLVTALALPISYLISLSFTRRLKNLILHMNKVETGNFNISILPGSNDEIGKLTRHFNHMLIKISMLLDEQYELGQKIKNTELLALQAQINPHFLYNALDQINWMGMENNVPEISTAVREISKFYKLSLSKGQSIVSIQNELEHVKAYVYIQNIRFSHAIHFEMDIPEGILPYKIPKITLQPIVENAILHGILESEKGKGTIRITGEVSEGNILLTVEDDGIGMSEDAMKNIMNTASPDEFHGYGIKNINEKLTLLYGEGYGLTFRRRSLGGTLVTIMIPNFSV